MYMNNHVHVQAALPGLHMSLGIFLKLWHLMEAECHQLDLELAMVTTGETGDRDGFLAHSRRIHEINALEEEKEQIMQYANALDGICTAMAAQYGEENQLISGLRREAIHTRDKIHAIVS